jgi:hypothetical protein
VRALAQFVCGRPVWPWFLVANTMWCAGVLGVGAVGVAWLAQTPDMAPLIAMYGTVGAVALGALWGSLLTTAEQRAWSGVWDCWLWRLPSWLGWAWHQAGRAALLIWSSDRARCRPATAAAEPLVVTFPRVREARRPRRPAARRRLPRREPPEED